MKLILNQQEINSAFGCRLEELGLANIDKSSIVVAFKSTRGADGSTEAEVDFNFHEPVNTPRATQPAAKETGTVDTITGPGNPADLDRPDAEADASDSGADSDDSAPATTSDLFGS